VGGEDEVDGLLFGTGDLREGEAALIRRREEGMVEDWEVCW
jgi:hypothetical protein